MMKIYFCGSIRGGRDLAATYEQLIAMLQNYGEVLTEHIGEKNVIMSESKSYSDDYIYERDMEWLAASDIVIAEVTTPSLGVGYEIGYAVEKKKPILCLYNEEASFKLSAMISGCPEIKTIQYKKLEDLKDPLEKFIRSF